MGNLVQGNDCYWSDQCECKCKCKDYTPIDTESEDIAEYNRILRENVKEYEDFVKEFNS